MVRGSESAGGDGAAISHQDGSARRRGDEPPAWSSVHDVPLPLGGSEGAQPPASPCRGPAKRGPKGYAGSHTVTGLPRSRPSRPESLDGKAAQAAGCRLSVADRPWSTQPRYPIRRSARYAQHSPQPALTEFSFSGLTTKDPVRLITCIRRASIVGCRYGASSRPPTTTPSARADALIGLWKPSCGRSG